MEAEAHDVESGLDMLVHVLATDPTSPLNTSTKMKRHAVISKAKSMLALRMQFHRTIRYSTICKARGVDQSKYIQVTLDNGGVSDLDLDLAHIEVVHGCNQ